jgi:serine/threonine-protein kinase
MDEMLGQYRVTGTIGRGGMGVVHAAEHALLGRRAAIKVLRAELSRDQDAVARFFNEARAAAAIRHPGIVEVYDFGWTSEGEAFFVMEHLDGESLTQRSARERFRWPAALAIARQIAGALAAAHAKGIIHRDLKPDNVFIVPDPEVPGGERIKLLDFGIAKLAQAPATATSYSATQTGTVIGTPTYMSPEQCRGVAVDHRADLYALGCVIYELCCGRPPFGGEGTGDVLAAHIHVPVPPMSKTNIEIPHIVESLVRRLLAKAPCDRLQSADKVILAIDALTSVRIPAPSESPATEQVMTGSAMTTLSGSVVMAASPRPGARRRWSIAAVAAVAAATAVAVAVVALRHDDEAGSAVAAPRVEVPAAAAAIAAPVASAPASIDVVVDSAPSGAEVVLGGAVQGTTPFAGRLPRGDRGVELVIRLAGYVERTIVVHPLAPVRARVALIREPAAVVPKRTTPERDRSVNPFD